MEASSEGGEGLLAGASLLTRPAEEFENDAAVELMWAKKAFEHAEIYFNILCSVDSSLLKLTPNDEEIYQLFRQVFPDFCVSVINEDEMKSTAQKEKWREYCLFFKDKVEDYSFGTLLRKDCTGDYTEENSILVTKIQFLAIELARNREGLNDSVRIKYSKKNSNTNKINTV
ncbi:conserved hypothetical protein [Pediculus humanus corporis]|uniref:Polysaccharide biosynthesis domain-containing protein n=1 Tax=Pediculus humanus subsp. corporis TaxID=121224 RepID=E0VV41_PEDHC|nr:uncharacterized protein Phum_PHUM458500 [Pediculus humanus corporis]EEB17247.1 conserved hypothetical protein [Pediculus humanus corporis]